VRLFHTPYLVQRTQTHTHTLTHKWLKLLSLTSLHPIRPYFLVPIPHKMENSYLVGHDRGDGPSGAVRSRSEHKGGSDSVQVCTPDGVPHQDAGPHGHKVVQGRLGEATEIIRQTTVQEEKIAGQGLGGINASEAIRGIQVSWRCSRPSKPLSHIWPNAASPFGLILGHRHLSGGHLLPKPLTSCPWLAERRVGSVSFTFVDRNSKTAEPTWLSGIQDFLLYQGCVSTPWHPQDKWQSQLDVGLGFLVWVLDAKVFPILNPDSNTVPRAEVRGYGVRGAGNEPTWRRRSAGFGARGTGHWAPIRNQHGGAEGTVSGVFT